MIQATRGEVAGERRGGAIERQINNFGQLWNKFREYQGVGGDGKREPQSRNQGRVGRHSG